MTGYPWGAIVDGAATARTSWGWNGSCGKKSQPFESIDLMNADWLEHCRSCEPCAQLLAEQQAAVAHLGDKPADPVRPDHYHRHTPHEVIPVISAWKLNFNRGNVIKYVARAALKGTELEDLKKAREYLDREIALVEAAK